MQRPSSALEAFHILIQQRGWSLVREKAIPSGSQLVVTDQVSTVHVSFYRTGTILIQGSSGALREALEAWKRELDGAALSPSSTTSVQHTPPASEVPGGSMRFHLAEGQWEPIYTQMLQLQEGQVSQQRCTDATQRWRLEIRQAQERVVSTFYTTGTLLVQGKASPLPLKTSTTKQKIPTPI